MKALALPNKTQVKFSEAEVGVIIHLDLEVYKPEVNWRQHMGREKISQALPLSLFNPSELDTDEWMKSIKAMGAKYAVLVAKHTSGFSLWPTTAHEYSVKNTPWKGGKGDIVKDFIRSCHKFGIEPGIYCSYAGNAYFNVDNGHVLNGSKADQDAYNAMYTTMVRELWGDKKYGNKKLFTIWFDGGVPNLQNGGPDLKTLMDEFINPGTNVFQGPDYTASLVRWIGNEVGSSPYPFWIPANATSNPSGYYTIEKVHGSEDGTRWVPGEADFPLREDRSWFQGGWFWNANNQRVLSLPELMNRYYTSVGSNTNMLAGIVIDTQGRIPDEDVRRMKEFGEAIKQFEHPLAKTSGVAVSLNLDLKAQREINSVLIQESIEQGQRVKSYVVEGLIGEKWLKICEGITIGHKRIQKFEPIKVSKIRLNITNSVAKPCIKKLAVYDIK